MIRPLTLATMVAAMGAGLHVYQTKHEVSLLDRELRGVARAIEEQNERTLALHAEWAWMNEPERLRQAAQRHLQLEPMQPAQFLRMTEVERRLPVAAAYEGPPALFAAREAGTAQGVEAAGPSLVLLARPRPAAAVRVVGIAAAAEEAPPRMAATAAEVPPEAPAHAATPPPTPPAAVGASVSVPSTAPTADPGSLAFPSAAIPFPPPAPVVASPQPRPAMETRPPVPEIAARSPPPRPVFTEAARPTPRAVVAAAAAAPRPASAAPPRPAAEAASLQPVAAPAVPVRPASVPVASIRPAMARGPASPAAASALAAQADTPAPTIGSLLGTSRPMLAPPVPFGTANAATLAGGGGATAR